MKKKILLVFLSFICVFSVAIGIAGMTNKNVRASEIAFTNNNCYRAQKTYHGIVNTFEATVNIASGTARQSIISNYADNNHESYTFEIHSGTDPLTGNAYGGRPRIYLVYANSSGTYVTTEAVFGKYKDNGAQVDVRGMGDVKIIITLTRTSASNCIARCWVGGRECLEVASSDAEGINGGIYNTTTYNYETFIVGNDYRRQAGLSDAKNVIKNITLFSTDRSNNAASDSTTFVKSGTGVICAYDFAGKGGVNTIKDESGNGYDLYIAPNYVQNPIDKSNGVTFSTGQYYKFTDVVDFPINSFEASVTVNAGSGTRAGVILGNYINETSTALNFELYTNNKMRVFAKVKDSSGNYSTTSVLFDDTTLNTAGTYHIAVTIDRVLKVMKYYVNGTLKETKTYTGLLGTTETFNSNAFRIGADCRANSTCTFKGTIHSVAIFSSIRTASNVGTDVTYVSTTTNGVKGYYNFGGKQGQKIVKDISNNGKNLKYCDDNKAENNITFTKNDLYQCSYKLTKAPNTFEAWVNVPANIADNDRVGVVVGNYNDFHLQGYKPNNVSFEIHENGKPRIFFRFNGDDSRSEVKFDYDMRTGVDTHLAITVDRTNQTATLYINGEIPMGCEKVAFTNATLSSPLAADDLTNEYPLVVGNDYRTDRDNSRFKGTIYSVAVYSDIRTKTEIRNDLENIENPDTSDALLLYNLIGQSGKQSIASLGGINNQLRIDNNIEHVWDDEVYYLQNENLSTLPLTVSAVVYLPSGYTSRAGVILGSYGQSREVFSFEINTNARLRLYVTDNAGVKTDITCSTSLTTGEWLQVAITINGTSVTFYQNGTSIGTGTFSSSKTINFSTGLVVGGDLRDKNENYFKGYIRGVAAYNDVRTAAEIANDYTRFCTVQGFFEKSNLMFAYDLQNKSGASTIQDLSNNDVDLIKQKMWLEASEVSISDFDYSFAVVGDTQRIIRQYDNYLNNDTTDTTFPPTQTFPKVYDYIVNNANSKNIAHVFGLGDVTETYPKWGGTHTPERSLREYELAKAQFTRLDNAKIPYSIVRGNHDDETNFDTYFGTSSNYASQYSEYYKNSYNSAHFFRAGNLDYMVVTLDFGATDDVLDWANDIIGRHPNRNVIITTHGYMFRDGTTLDSGDIEPPTKGNANANNGDSMWDKLVSKHENIVLTLSGHDPCNAIVSAELTGVNGNKVQNLLIDPQGLDDSFKSSGGVGAVAMLYFSNNGKTVEVRWWSTAQNKYIRTSNQFTITLNTVEAIGETSIWDGSYPNVTNGYDFTGHGTEKHPYLIFTAQDLAALSALSVGQNYGAGVYYKVMRNINLGNNNWMPICDNNSATPGGWQGGNPGDTNWKAFNGVFDGNGKTITFNQNTDLTCVALFMGLSNAVVKDLNLAGQISSGVYTSALCVLVHGQTTLENINSSVDITVEAATNNYRQARAGAIAGQVNGNNNTFINCENTGDIICTDKDEKIGGIVGFAYGAVELQDCSNAGIISGRVQASTDFGINPSYVGELIGDYYSKKVTATWVVNGVTTTSQEGWGHIAVYQRQNNDDPVGVPPTKDSDNASLKYEFAGWGTNGENGTDVVTRVPITNAEGITYYARFTTLYKITVEANNADWGSVAITQSEYLIDGTSFWAYKGATFTTQDNVLTLLGTAYFNEVEKTTATILTATPNAPTVQFTFILDGWSNASSAIDADRIVTANFITSTNSYTITWKNYDGTTLKTDIVQYGTIPSYNGETPIKESNIHVTYMFDGWNPELYAVTGDEIYVATFREVASVYASLTIKETVGINFYIDVEKYTADPYAYLDLEYNHNKLDYQPDIRTSRFMVTSVPIIDGTRKFSISFASGQIADNINLRLYTSQGVLVYEKINYSILQYCQAIIESSDDVDLVNLCKSLINYGKYSKEYFGYMPEVEIEKAMDLPANINSQDVPQASKTENASYVQFSRYSFVALSDTSIRIYFTIDGNFILDSYDISLSYNCNSTMGYKVGSNDYGYFVEVYGIESTNISELFTVTITFNGNNSKTIITYSALNYLYEKAQDVKSSQALKDMCLAIYQYNLYAKAYFNR